LSASHPDTLGNGVAPPWFARLLPLRVPVAQRAISDGWKQVGNLSVTVDNTFARDALWSSSIRMGLLVLVAGGLWALSVVGLLSWFSRVLREEISAQVMAIGATASGTTAPGAVAPLRSKVAELTDVVHAISDTRERVRATAQEQTQRIESLEVELNRDQVTMLPNRKYFMNELRRARRDVGQTARRCPWAAMCCCSPARSAGAQHLYDPRPRRRVAGRLAEAQGSALGRRRPAGTLLARLNGSDFIVLMPGMEGPAAMHVVQQIKHDLQALRQPMARANGAAGPMR
jgi:GGDEF domain-containing protein